MKIVHLITSLDTGGAETLVKDYAMNFNKEHEFIVVIIHRGKEETANEKQLRDAGIRVIALADLFPIQKLKIKKIPILYKRIKWFGQFIVDESIDVIHTHLSINIYLYANRRKLENTKLVHTVHNEPKKIYNKSLGRILESFFVKKLIKQNNLHLIALHYNMREELVEMFDTENITVLNNGINLERFDRELYNKSDIRTTLNLKSNDFVVGHIGRFVEQKNHHFIIEVFIDFLKLVPSAKLLLVGSGELKQEIVKKINLIGIDKSVIMLENRSDIPSVMSVMDVFIFPSLYEGLGIVLVEAQALGIKCVVSSEVPNAAHLTEYYSVLNLDEPSEVWAKELTSSNKSEPCGKLCEYDMRKVVEKLEQIYLGEI